MTSTEARSKIDKFLIELTEHLPSAHIEVLVSFNEEGLTKSFHTGIGNWHARQGLAHEFIQADIAQENARQISERMAPPDAPGEAWIEI